MNQHHCPNTGVLPSSGQDNTVLSPFLNDNDGDLDLVLLALDLSRLCDLDRFDRECLCVLCFRFFFLTDLECGLTSVMSVEFMYVDPFFVYVALLTFEFLPGDNDISASL